MVTKTRVPTITTSTNLLLEALTSTVVQEKQIKNISTERQKHKYYY